MKKDKMRVTNAEPATQHAALCYRRTTSGAPEILLITSRDTGRWVLPKGWPKKTEAGGDSALREAFEEAGVAGRQTGACAGAYGYDKTMPDGPARPCQVTVHVIEVLYLDYNFPERGLRRLQWFSPDAAAAAVEETELKSLLATFAPSGNA
ncbi:MAG: NUDIX hydrolase [Rhodobacteraceae bacterium]|nr:NUDIX hydrolase [Paracoccaceae bacterium]